MAVQLGDVWCMDGTDPRVVDVLRNAKASKVRVRLFYGDRNTGEDGCEVHDIMGYVGKSTGKLPCLILIPNSRSSGGTAILTTAILKITIDKRTVYQVSNYRTPELTIAKSSNKFSVIRKKLDGSIVTIANFETNEAALKFKNFLEGISNRY